ncbi:hypothetical protein [Streptomyces violaceusniger]|uniref:hypothetical protein n=1 Tax=Streptomyces violaceusniger TaxID=68280 RepID=UPI00142F2923|nr:hypothetical protein [Streptomyces violaceusniger]
MPCGEAPQGRGLLSRPRPYARPSGLPVGRVFIICRSWAGRSSLPRTRAARNRLRSVPLEIMLPLGPATEELISVMSMSGVSSPGRT